MGLKGTHQITARARLALPFAMAAPRLLLGQQRAKPNLLLVAVDDLNTDIGCYGHAMVRTPNIDRLARRGVRFDRAFCQYPVCNPSRTSLLSGRYPETTGIFDNRTNPRTHLKDDALFLPEYLRRNGYFTARVGKIYHDGMDGPEDWDVSLNPRPASSLGRTGEGRNLTGGKFAFFEWRAAEGGDEDQPDGLIAAEAVRLLGEKRDRPFFVAVGLRKPHDQYIAPKKYFEPYPLDRIAGPPGPADDEADIPPAAYPPVRHNLGALEGREFRRAYYACISFMDAQLGKVLDALDRSPAARNTVVIFFSDHGLHLGEHGWWNKVTLFDRSIRVPLIIAAPGMENRGAACSRPVELIDLYPTVTEMVGLRQPAGLEGRSIASLLANVEAPWARPAYSVVTRSGRLGRSIQTARFRYTEWDEGRLGIELYDHNQDPHEYRNLASDSDYASHVRELKALLGKARPAGRSQQQ
ncbi:MAG: sulfatase [Acidobacteria bacterium]|nr:sulfatase [Acidobacteriota bacterium]